VDPQAKKSEKEIVAANESFQNFIAPQSKEIPEQHYKGLCANCKGWSYPEEITFAVNVDGQAIVNWHCVLCRRYNDIELGKVTTRA